MLFRSTTLLTFEQRIDERQIEIQGLEEASPVQIYGDKDLLHQVVYNLVENAVKFTNPGGTIRVLTADSVDRTTVVIENSGQGISADDLPMVFERFYKADKSRSRDKNGMGLGLYLVKTILNLHGGNIQVKSVQGQFCRFEFWVPKPQETPRIKDSQPKTKESVLRLKEPRFRSKLGKGGRGEKRTSPPQGAKEKDEPKASEDQETGSTEREGKEQGK